MPTFAENNDIGATVELLRSAMMNLCSLGYLIPSYQCRGNQLSIEIDKPLCYGERVYAQIGNQKIAFVTLNRCRIYWKIADMEGQSCDA